MSARICIDARLEPGVDGGVEQVILGLAGGFAALGCAGMDINFITHRNMAEQLTPLFQGHSCLRCTIVPASHKRTVSETMDRIFGLELADWLKHLIYKLAGSRIFNILKDEELIEGGDFDLIHFPTQQACWTAKPNIYHPHDLQHLHLPQFFSRFKYQSREYKYRKFCDQATAVAVTSTWIKQDLMESYGLAEEKVKVIPLAPPNEHYAAPDDAQLAEISQSLSLPDRFVFYPAQSWKHKNHLALIRAVAKLKEDHGLVIPLVFSGKTTPFRKELEKEIGRLGLTGSVSFLGFVSPTELQALYQLCTAVVIPSRYEAASFPLWEAYLAGAPTACSSITSLPKQAGDASLIFDPHDVDELSRVVHRLWTDEALRHDLIEKGTRRVEQFTWKTTCSQFLALYRHLLGCPLSGDSDLLDREPII